MLQWALENIELELKEKWTINGGEVLTKTNPIIRVEQNGSFGIGEIACSTKNNDQPLIISELKKMELNHIQNFKDLIHLKTIPQIRHGIELALINLHLAKHKITLSDYFSIPKTDHVQTNYSIPIMPSSNVGHYIEKNNIQKYKSCKVKVNGSSSLQFLNEVKKHYSGALRIDANECFNSSNECLDFINKCHDLNVEFLEQPLDRKNISDGVLLKKESPWLLIGDESLQSESIQQNHIDCFHGLNIKLMKAGGPTKALSQIKQCQKLDLKILIGCMVESSLNIVTAMKLGYCADWFDLDGFLLLKSDPYKLINNTDGFLTINL